MKSKAIVGLGNPGKDYEMTRHNLGFLVVEKLAERSKVSFKNCSFTKAQIVEGDADGQKFILLEPMTFMNNSGIAVQALLQKKGIEPSEILIVCDDLDLPFAQLRIRSEGSAGGHNGLKSIIEHVGTAAFARLRLGIGRPSGETVDFVLDKFSALEKKDLSQFVDEATDCCLVWLKDGINKAMDQFNRRKDNGKSSISK